MSKESEEFRSRDWNQFKALVSGVGQIPLDAVRYPALMANWGMEKTGMRSPDQANNARQAINEFGDRPFFLPDYVNNERARLQEAHPNFSAAGEVGGAVGLTKALLKRSMNLVKNNKGNHTFTNRLTGHKVHSPAMYYGVATGAALNKELMVEDAIQNVAGDQ